jgi:hypothetical protein
MVNGFPEMEKTKNCSRVGQTLDALCGINAHSNDNNLFFIRGNILPHYLAPKHKLASAHISDILSAILTRVLALLSLPVCTVSTDLIRHKYKSSIFPYLRGTVNNYPQCSCICVSVGSTVVFVCIARRGSLFITTVQV